MKICFLNHDMRQDTGSGRFYNELISAIRRSSGDITSEVLTSENSIRANKVGILFSLPRILSTIRKCDVIHALDGWPYGIIGAFAAKLLKKKLIITAVGSGAVQPLHRFWKRPFMAWAYRSADQVVAISNNTKKEISKILPDLDIKVIHHGVDLSKFGSVSGKYQKEAEQYKPYILSVGTLKKRKGFNYSIDAFIKISGKFPELKYLIVGGGSERSALDKKIAGAGLGERIRFISGIDQDLLASLYQNAEMFILLSQDIEKDLEGFGLVFLEAAACGVPVIGTKDTSAEDAIANGKNGLLVPMGDSDEAASAIGKILSDKKLGLSMSAQSLEFAREMTWDKAAKGYLEVYKDIN